MRFRNESFSSLLNSISFAAGRLSCDLFCYRTNAARQQRRDVAIIRNAGGTVYYDWMLQPIYDADGNVPYFKVVNDPDTIDAPKWMRESLGDEFFQRVAKVHLPVNSIDDDVLAALLNLPALTEIDLLPNSAGQPPVTDYEIDELRTRVSQATGVQVAGPFGEPEFR